MFMYIYNSWKEFESLEMKTIDLLRESYCEYVYIPWLWGLSIEAECLNDDR